MERKLTAIFSADVQGYSRLMGEDEEATIRTLTAYRVVLTSSIQQQRGRVVDSPGDNLLAEFASVVDTSAWIEFLRASGHPIHLALRHHLTRHSPIVTTEVVIMEVLAGARNRREFNSLRNRLTAFPQLTLRGLSDFEHAAELYRLCRERGITVRKLIDCLIAAVAIRVGASVLHNDRDFDGIAHCTRLRTEPLVP